MSGKYSVSNCDRAVSRDRQPRGPAMGAKETYKGVPVLTSPACTSATYRGNGGHDLFPTDDRYTQRRKQRRKWDGQRAP